jgi:hypothetical protein
MKRPDRDRGRDLRATAENVRADARRLEAIERLKESLDVDSPLIPTLSEAAAGLGTEVAKKTALEKALANDAAGD